jgi:hypothetical protein
MQEIQTFDLYEGSFYLSKNCSIETIEAIMVDGKVNCRITIAGESIHTLQATYFSGDAEIRLFDFRRTYSQLQKLVHDAKRKYKLQMKHQQYAGGQV